MSHSQHHGRKQIVRLPWSLDALQWRHNGCDGVSNHQPNDWLLNRLFRRRSKKTSNLRVTGLCAGNSPGTGEFPAQMASNAENVSIGWRHHGLSNGKYLARIKVVEVNTSRARLYISLHFGTLWYQHTIFYFINSRFIDVLCASVPPYIQFSVCSDLIIWTPLSTYLINRFEYSTILLTIFRFNFDKTVWCWWAIAQKLWIKAFIESNVEL